MLFLSHCYYSLKTHETLNNGNKKNETFYPQWSVKHPLRTIHAEWPLQNKSMEILAFKCGYFTSNKDNFMIRYRKKCFSENKIAFE